MQTHAIFDTAGRPVGFYHEGAIPAEAIIISEVDYQAYLQEPGKWHRDPATGQRVAAPPPPPPTREESLVGIRSERNRRLAACDWTQNPTARLTAEQLAAWNKYRDQLFDFPESCDPADPVWPVPE